MTTKIIKLTESFKNRDTKPLYLNVAHIISFKIGDSGQDTHVTVPDNKWFFVTEKVDVVAALINQELAK